VLCEKDLTFAYLGQRITHYGILASFDVGYMWGIHVCAVRCSFTQSHLNKHRTFGTFRSYKCHSKTRLTQFDCGCVTELSNHEGHHFSFPACCRISRVSGLWRVCRNTGYGCAFTREEHCLSLYLQKNIWT